ncbi:TAXI family TRAP transporter solute-binding subunit [Neosynechococcus sphagnicola]|uniref:TAXI family TRAP transporter solute-binding subunit n=1 Tax=Neosynechococcus sphagnicola TaxID=1501145 RepID=UPI0019553BA6|nr:TAXI family TRAP transporter solute-binding subunit [Neosynechococcus sphagnicola]
MREIPATAGSTLKLLPVDRKFLDDRQEILTRFNLLYLPQQIPANTYPWQPQAVDAIATVSFLYVNHNLDQQTVYNLAKAAYPKAPKLQAIDSFWTLFSIANAKSPTFKAVDYHVGVKKFLAEQ